MRTWNFIKLDDISCRVTETRSFEGRKRAPRILPRTMTVTAIVLGAVLTGAAPAMAGDVHMSVTATPEVSTVLIQSIETSQVHRAPFDDQFALFHTEAFLEAHGAVLDAIAAVGSSLDLGRDSDGVALALQDLGNGESLESAGHTEVLRIERVFG